MSEIFLFGFCSFCKQNLDFDFVHFARAVSNFDRKSFGPLLCLYFAPEMDYVAGNKCRASRGSRSQVRVFKCGGNQIYLLCESASLEAALCLVLVNYPTGYELPVDYINWE